MKYESISRYVQKDNYSRASILWLEYVVYSEGRDGNIIEIQHALRGGEWRIWGRNIKPTLLRLHQYRLRIQRLFVAWLQKMLQGQPADNRSSPYQTVFGGVIRPDKNKGDYPTATGIQVRVHLGTRLARDGEFRVGGGVVRVAT